MLQKPQATRAAEQTQMACGKLPGLPAVQVEDTSWMCGYNLFFWARGTVWGSCCQGGRSPSVWTPLPILPCPGREAKLPRGTVERHWPKKSRPSRGCSPLQTSSLRTESGRMTLSTSLLRILIMFFWMARQFCVNFEYLELFRYCHPPCRRKKFSLLKLQVSMQGSELGLMVAGWCRRCTDDEDNISPWRSWSREAGRGKHALTNTAG